MLTQILALFIILSVKFLTVDLPSLVTPLELNSIGATKLGSNETKAVPRQDALSQCSVKLA